MAPHDVNDAPALGLERLLALLELAPHQVQAFDPEHPAFDAQRPLLVLPAQFEVARPLVRRRYPPALDARAVVDGAVEAVTVAALPLDAAAWLLPALAPEEDRRSLAGLRGVMELLFGPEGCPWDREQTHETLRRYLLEEVYELVDTIDRGDMAGLREEVGDVLAHMFMQTALAQQAGTFTLEDAVEDAHDKFVRRHPHVFGDEHADSGAWVAERWEAMKRAERAEQAAQNEDEEVPGALDSVPAAAPSLQRAQALTGRARRAGLGDPPDALAALHAALEASERSGEAIGELLFAAMLLAREVDVDAEEALRETANRFVRAFADLEREARERGLEVSELDADRRAAVWASVLSSSRGSPVDR